jgi:hypothetical protein
MGPTLQDAPAAGTMQRQQALRSIFRSSSINQPPQGVTGTFVFCAFVPKLTQWAHMDMAVTHLNTST